MVALEEFNENEQVGRFSLILVGLNLTRKRSKKVLEAIMWP